MKEVKTALIIGAGPAGLTVAYELLRNTDIKPVILEASPYIGGISRTARHGGNRMDIGGHRFFTRDESVQQLWSELLPLQGKPSFDDRMLKRSDIPLADQGPDPENTDDVMLIRSRVSRIFYMRKFFAYPVSLSRNTLHNMGLGRTMKVGFGYLASMVRKRPEDSLENFYINRFGKPLYSMFFEAYTEKLWGRHPSRISADWGAQRVKGLSLRKTVGHAISKPFRRCQEVETSLIEQFQYPKCGPGQYWEKMAQAVQDRGGEILLNHEVVELGTEGNGIAYISARDNVNGSLRRFTGEYYFSTMPVKDLFSALRSDVPAEIARIAEDLPYRDFMTVGLLVRKLVLNNQSGIPTIHRGVPDNWIYIQEPDVEIGRLQIFNNWSPYMVEKPEETVWMGLEYFCDEGDKFWNMTDEAFIDFAVDELERIQIIDRKDVLDAVRIKVKKAYPAYFGSYRHFNLVKDYLEAIPNLYCIGRNGQHRYNNMDHSMLTAIKAVEAVMGRADKRDIWEVNTEKTYHEEAKNHVKQKK